MMSFNDEKIASADAYQVEMLTQAIGNALERTAIPEITTPAEVISALFTTLERMLRNMQQFETEDDRIINTKELNRVLTDMILEFGSTRH